MKKILVALLMLSLSVAIIGCSNKPEGNPQDVIEAYYSFIHSADYESAYDLLSDTLKKDVDLDEFINWNDLLTLVHENDEYKFTLLEETEDEKLEGNEFSSINKFKVNKSWISLYSDKQEIDNNEEYVVSEDKEWKVYRLKKDFNIDEKIANIYNQLGWMYYEGKGESLDMNKAIEMFSNSVEYDDYHYYHYSLAVALEEMNRFDESPYVLG